MDAIDVSAIALLFQHAAARRRLTSMGNYDNGLIMFQHAAARRRLSRCVVLDDELVLVSTRSRPKAADSGKTETFNHPILFQHAAARRRLTSSSVRLDFLMSFQHAAARRRLIGL